MTHETDHLLYHDSQCPVTRLTAVAEPSLPFQNLPSAHRLPQAAWAGHVLQVHEAVAEELGEGDPGLRVPLQEPEQEVPAVSRHPGPRGELERGERVGGGHVVWESEQDYI